MWWGVGGRLKGQGIYVHIWLIHDLYSRKYHNIVKQLHSNFFFKGKVECKNIRDTNAKDPKTQM